jgi:hypothetical protein
VTVVKHSFRCKYKGNETFCSFKIVVCQKGTYLFTSIFNFPTVIRFKLQSSERFKWSEFNIGDPDLTKCFISFIFTTERVFYNSHLYSLYVGSLLQLCSFCFTANVLKNIMDNFDNALKHNYNYNCSCYFNIIFVLMF